MDFHNQLVISVCECNVVKDTGKEEYLRPFIHIGLDWIFHLKCKTELTAPH